MIKASLAICLFLFLQSAWGQAYRTPSRMQFADLELILSEPLRKEIQSEVEALTRHPKYLNIKLDRAKMYFPIIERIFREEKLPDDFKYLVLQESALISDAVSTSNAVGFWQFKKEAAQEVGLRMDAAVDERLNIVSSSRGAAKYLKTNNFYFDNWLYALIAYNTGRGGAQRYIDSRQFGTKKMHIDKSLHWYAKKFLAHKIAFEAALAGYQEPDLFLYEFEGGANQSLSHIARQFKVDETELTEYNKWIKRGSVPSDKRYAVIVPLKSDQRPDLIAKSQTEKNPAETYDIADSDEFPKIEKFEGFDAVTVQINGKEGVIAKASDNVRSLSLIGNLSADQFRKINDLGQVDEVAPGQVYYFEKKRNKAKTHFHVAQHGETLWSISQKYGVKLRKLLQKNRMNSENELKPGMMLWLRFIRPKNHPVQFIPVEQKPLQVREAPVAQREIRTNSGELTTPKRKEFAVESPVVEREISAPAHSGVEKTDEVKVHTVEAGETLYGLSRRYNASVEELLKWNELNGGYEIKTGQRLIVAQPAAVVADLPQTKENDGKSYIYHKVEAGDTLYKIARQYNVAVKELMEWNDKKDFSLQLNETIKIMRP